jgi:DNA repair protein RadC
MSAESHPPAAVCFQSHLAETRGAAPSPGVLDRGGPSAAELRTWAARAGLAALTSTEVLALFLARAAPGRSLGLARRLLDRFGSLPEVLGATEGELGQVASPAAALELRLLHELQLLVLREPFRRRSVMGSWSAVLSYLRAAMAALPREQFRVLFLDRRNRLIADEVLGWGSLDHAPVYPREVVRRALELSAAALVLSHNHPAGDPTPSAADVDMTRQVVDAALALRIKVHDHVIVAAEGAASLRALGLM